jgi:hypothetical protein
MERWKNNNHNHNNNNNNLQFTRPQALGGVAVEPTTGGGLARQQHTSPETQEPRESLGTGGRGDQGNGRWHVTAQYDLDPSTPLTGVPVLFCSPSPRLSRVSRLVYNSPFLSPSLHGSRERADGHA